MNKTFINFIVFVTGAAVGSVVTWKVVKTKYEKIAQEEIDSVKAVFSKREIPDSTPEFETKSHAEVKPDLNSLYAKVLNKEEYDYSANENKKKSEAKLMENSDIPYVIDPKEFDTIDGYEAVTFTYYADDVVADEWDNAIEDEDVDEMLGLESLTHFGQYEEDAVYVRNDGLKTDYEILRDDARFYDLHPTELIDDSEDE